jgi:hypothetical protein
MLSLRLRIYAIGLKIFAILSGSLLEYLGTGSDLLFSCIYTHTEYDHFLTSRCFVNFAIETT